MSEEQTLPDWKKEVNAKWLSELKEELNPNGIWIWKATGFVYTLTNGKFVGDSEEATVALKKILPDNDVNV